MSKYYLVSVLVTMDFTEEDPFTLSPIEPRVDVYPARESQLGNFLGIQSTRECTEAEYSKAFKAMFC